MPAHHPISLDQLECPVTVSTEEFGSLGELGSLSLRTPLRLWGGTRSGIGARVRLDDVDWAVARRALRQGKELGDNETEAKTLDLTVRTYFMFFSKSSQFVVTDTGLFVCSFTVGGQLECACWACYRSHVPGRFRLSVSWRSPLSTNSRTSASPLQFWPGSRDTSSTHSRTQVRKSPYRMCASRHRAPPSTLSTRRRGGRPHSNARRSIASALLRRRCAAPKCARLARRALEHRARNLRSRAPSSRRPRPHTAKRRQRVRSVWLR